MADDATEATVGITRNEGNSGALTFQMPRNTRGTFVIYDSEGGQQQASFEGVRDGKVLRYYNSRRFPSGGIKKRGEKTQGNIYVVDLWKQRELDLRNYFE